MKVLLVKDVPGQGIAGELKEVSPGFARNFLFAKKYAVAADASTIAEVQQRQERVRKAIEKQRKEAAGLADRLKKLTVTVYAKAGENGKLFGSITAQDIASQLKREAGIEVDKRHIDFPEQIRSLGSHEATILLHENITATVRVVVVAE